ncbi:cold shock domain-containing protein [Streptomyces sp. NPDC008139]|uniref:cold-shock protein n=1 Tax=Streptomyces sp. NPDC008139 TaxID=3364814 RepID=UPI0036F01481
MATGTVKWFSFARGFGFIEQSGGGDDVFAHYSNLVDDTLPGLTEGQKVHFDITQNPRGLYAQNIACDAEARHPLGDGPCAGQ